MFKFTKRHAFTLAEAVIVLIFLSIIAARIIPAVDSTRPSTEKVLFRKAYLLTETVVSDLISDELLYPFDEMDYERKNKNDTAMLCENPNTYKLDTVIPTSFLYQPAATTDGAYIRFRSIVQNSLCAPTNSLGDNGYAVRSFCAKMNPIEASCDSETNCTFVTGDGMAWTVTRNTAVNYTSVYNSANCTNKAVLDTNPAISVFVDVNGSAEPNVETGVNVPDQYRFDIYYDGSVRVNTTFSAKGEIFLKNPTNNKRRSDLDDARGGND